MQQHTMRFGNTLLPIFLFFFVQSPLLFTKTVTAAQTWPPAGDSVRIPITSDTSLSSVGKERQGDDGGSRVLKLKGRQEVALLSFPTQKLRGRVITGALLHIRSASPARAPLLRIGISSVAVPWTAGTSSAYRPEKGAASFAQAAYPDRDWAYPGSTLMDVVFGKGHTIWKFSDCTPPDGKGWQTCAVDPDILAAQVTGLSHGLCLYDEVGSTWSQRKGGFSYHYFPNRRFYSRESGSGPWLEVWTKKREGTSPPPPVRKLTVVTNNLPAGEAIVSWKIPGEGGTEPFGFYITYQDGNGSHPVPRYLIPMAGKPGNEVTMHLQDLSFKAGEAINLKIITVDRTGKRSTGFSQQIRVASGVDLPPVALHDFAPFKSDSSLPTLQGVAVAILDLTDKVNPTNGIMIPRHDPGYQGGNHLYDGAHQKIRLFGARNETVFFQVNLSGKAEHVDVRLTFPGVPLLRPKLFKFSYVTAKKSIWGDTLLPDPLVPLKGSFSTPDKKVAPLAGSRKNQSLICALYIPHSVSPGKKRGAFTVAVGGRSISFSVELHVWNFTLPDKLSFIPEMNAYTTVYPFRAYSYYRLAHEYRTCINWLPYGWNGTPALAPRWDGAKFHWQAWDKEVSPLLNGSAFAGLPRQEEPVDVFYLPFNENWPIDLRRNYHPSYWADEAFSPHYAKELGDAMRAFAKHIAQKKWTGTIFQFFLNNKIYFRHRYPQCSAPWIFDEPVNTQDFWALRWYGQIWQKATGRISAASGTSLWFRGDISASQFSRNMLWGIMDEEYLGGITPQKTRMQHDEQLLTGTGYFAEYGSANKISQPNTQPELWCISAWLKGAIGVLPWQTIGTKKSWQKAEQTALFYPGANGPYPSVRLLAFSRGQQDVEYLALFSKAYGLPRYAVKKIVNKFISLHETVEKQSEASAGTASFASASDASIDLWRLRCWLGRMISQKAPPYARQLVKFKTVPYSQRKLPDIGYVRPAPFVEAVRPEVVPYYRHANEPRGAPH